MKNNRFFNSLDFVFNYIYYFSKLNLYFWYYTIKGGVVFGFFPSFIALMKVSSYNDIKESEIIIKKKFSKEYKRLFWKANKVGAILAVITLIFYLNFITMSSGLVSYSIINVFAFYTILFLSISMSIWLIPIITIKDLSITYSIKHSFIFSIYYLHYTIMFLIILFIITYCSLRSPALILFFSFSIYSYIVMKTIKKLVIKTTE